MIEEENIVPTESGSIISTTYVSSTRNNETDDSVSNTKETNTIHIVDAICGSGKTSAAINYINKLDPNTHVLYITPYLDEVKRIKYNCSNKNFKEPNVSLGHGSKLRNLEDLLMLGENIVSTHALFGHMNQSCLKALEANNYILIMDEVTEVIKQYDIDIDDLKLMLTDFAEVGKYGIIHWKDEDYTGTKFAIEKNLCEQESLAIINNNVLSWLFPVNVFKAFKETFILTYLFEGQYQKYYYDLYDLKYDYIGVKKLDSYIEDNKGNKYPYYVFDFKNEMLIEKELCSKNQLNLSSKIHIIDNKQMNVLGEPITAFSKSWYEKNIDTGIFTKTLKNNLYNFFFNFMKTKSNQNLWTTFKEYESKLKGKGYTKGFLACNARATNLYRDRTAVAYLCNRYMQPLLVQYFTSHGIKVDQDKYALSELIQFIYRSAIRDDKDIWVYIPSRRMRELFEEWLRDLG